MKWSEVARQAILERLERLEEPVGFNASTSDLAKLIANSGVNLNEVSVNEPVQYYKKMRELEWRKISTNQAS